MNDILRVVLQTCDVLSVAVSEFSPRGNLADGDPVAYALTDLASAIERDPNTDRFVDPDLFMRSAACWSGMNEAKIDFVLSCLQTKATASFSIEAIDSSLWKLTGENDLVDRVALECLLLSPGLLMTNGATQPEDLQPPPR